MKKVDWDRSQVGVTITMVLEQFIWDSSNLQIQINQTIYLYPF
jgi:hypothetical protein